MLLVHYDVGVDVGACQDARGQLRNLSGVDPGVHGLGGELVGLVVGLDELLHLVLVHVALVVRVHVVQRVLAQELPPVLKVVHRTAHDHGVVGVLSHLIVSLRLLLWVAR